MERKLNYFFIITVSVIFCGLLYFLAPILTPFVVGTLLAYLVDPVVNQLMRLRLPRLLAVVIVFINLFLLITLFVLLLIPLIQKQMTLLIELVPASLSWVQVTLFPWLQTHFGIQETLDLETIKTIIAENWMKAGDVASGALKATLHSGIAIFQWITNLVLIPVVTFYLLRDWNEIIINIRKILPRSIQPTVVKLAKECDEVLSAFFRGQLLVMLALGSIYSVGLMSMGLSLGLIIGMIAGLASIVPYLGFIVGIIAASIAAFIQFGTLTSVLSVFIVFAIGQSLESSLLTPKLVGDRIGLHPVAVIFSVLAGGYLVGFFGVLLALPVAAVLMVLLRFLFQHYQHSSLYQ